MVSLIIFKSNSRGMRYGIGTYINHLINSLLKYNDICIILVNFHSDKFKEFNITKDLKKYKEINIPSPKLFSLLSLGTEKYAARIVDLLTPYINNSEGIIFQINHVDALPIAKILKTKYEYPVISIVHSAQWQFIFNGNKQKFEQSWDSNIQNPHMKPIEEEKELYCLSNLIISVTDYMKEFLIKYYCIPEEKIIVIHNGIDDSIFHLPSVKEKLKIKNSLGFKKDEKIILFSGRLDQSKGLYFLIDAFREVVKIYSNIRLVLVGEDSGPDKITQYLNHCSNIWGKVTFTGFITYEQILKFYQIADIGIIPSIYDHGTYVALEMIGHNVPLIVSNTEGFDEFLSTEQCIYLNQIFDKEGDIGFEVNDIVNAILALIHDAKMSKKITYDYQSMIANRLSSKRMAAEYYSLFKSLY